MLGGPAGRVEAGLAKAAVDLARIQEMIEERDEQGSRFRGKKTLKSAKSAGYGSKAKVLGAVSRVPFPLWQPRSGTCAHRASRAGPPDASDSTVNSFRLSTLTDQLRKTLYSRRTCVFIMSNRQDRWDYYLDSIGKIRGRQETKGPAHEGR